MAAVEDTEISQLVAIDASADGWEAVAGYAFTRLANHTFT